MLGYFEESEQTLREDGWLRTGDLATMDERGYCRIIGRLKDMIIRGGENLFPVEIEEVLYQHPAVAEVAVVGLPDPYWGEVVAASIRPRDPAVLPTIPDLHSHMRERLSAQKTPTKWYAVDGTPLTGSGKIQKFAPPTRDPGHPPRGHHGGDHRAKADDRLEQQCDRRRPPVSDLSTITPPCHHGTRASRTLGRGGRALANPARAGLRGVSEPIRNLRPRTGPLSRAR